MKYLLLITLSFSCLAEAKPFKKTHLSKTSSKKISNKKKKTKRKIATNLSFEDISKATALIVHEKGTGSGFFISKSLLVTNYHVIENAKDSIVYFGTPDNREGIGMVFLTDKKHDLAIIKTLTKNYPYLKLANSNQVKLGDSISVIGSPKGLIGTLSKGIVSAKRSQGDILQFTAPISQGSSGSPIISKDNKVIGVVTSVLQEGQNLNFAVSSNKLRYLIKSNLSKLKEINKIDVQKEINDRKKQLITLENKSNKTIDELTKLAYSYYNQKKYKKAFYYYKQAAEQGHSDAQYNLSVMHRDGKGTLQGHKKALYWAQKAAEQKNIHAQFLLGIMYSIGRETTQNYKAAFYYYKQAAKQGHAKAQFLIGIMHGAGEGITKDEKKAFYWIQKSAEQGYSDAQYELGMIYEFDEKKTLQNYKKALHFYNQASKQGHKKAQNSLGTMYLEGRGTLKDNKKAFYYYSQAAEQGYSLSQYNLAIMHYQGKGTLKDNKKSFYWNQKAAEQGYTNAQINLSIQYLKGEGTPQNDIYAYAWANIAAINDAKAKLLRDKISTLMTPEEISKAQGLSKILKQ